MDQDDTYENEQITMDEDLRNRYHAMDYLMESPRLTREDKVKKVSALFEDFTDSNEEDAFLTDFAIEQYYYSRSLGMSLEDSAMNIDLSYMRLADFLKGRNISLERFYALVVAELRALPSLKQKLLRQIERQGTIENDLSAVTTLLNKLEKDDDNGKSVALNIFLAD